MANPIDLLKEVAGKFAGIEESLAKLTAAETELGEAKASIDVQTQTIATATAALDKEKAAHSETKAALEKSQGEVNAAGAKIKDLEKAVVEAKQTAANIIAAQGIPSEQLPAAGVTSNPIAAKTAPALDPKLKGRARLMAAFATPANPKN